MEMDIGVICRNRGLSPYEVSALIGSCHTTQLKIEACKKHRPMTTSFFWLFHCLSSDQVIPALLDRWLNDKPKDEEQVRLLIQIAKRHKKGDSFKTWINVMRKQHPEFFF